MNDNDFIKNDNVPMTKQEIRYVSMGYLDIVSKKKFLDVGTGTGTISIEALVQNKDIKVIAIESNDKAYSTTLMNIEFFDKKYKNIKNRIELINKKAPLDLDDKFDSIFIGGTKGNIKEIINWSSKLLINKGVLVLNFITLENFYDAVNSIEENKNLICSEVSQIMINKIESLSKYKYLKPNNPIFVLKCIKI